MQMNLKTALAGLAALTLTACGSVYDEAILSAPSGSAFNQALHAKYLELARFEYVEMEDYADADHFAAKALATIEGPVAPDTVESRDIPAVDVTGYLQNPVADLQEARRQLVDALAANATVNMPEDAAEAQASYDCWLEQQEENFQPEDIEACRTRFETALAKITVGEPIGTVIIYFDWDSDIISPAGFEKVRVAADAARDAGELLVNGYTDTSGSRAYNVGLSRRRAENVASALIAEGINAEILRIRDYGEDPAFLAVQTGDGVREAANRRVEIVFPN